MNTNSNESVDILEYDSSSNTYHTVLEWTTHDPSIAVVELFARLLGVDPVDVDPLAASIDPAALDALLQGQERRLRAENCTVVFTYLGHRVTVSSDGYVEIEPPTDAEAGDRPTAPDSTEGGAVDWDESRDAEAAPEAPEASEASETDGDDDGDEDLPRAG